MRKKNDRVKVPLAIPKLCDFFFFWTDQCWLPSNTHTHMRTHTHTHTERKREGSIVMI